MCRVTDRPKWGRTVMRAAATMQRKNRANTKTGALTATRVRKLHVRHGAMKPMRRSRDVSKGADKPMQKIKALSDNGISQPMRRKKGIQSTRTNDPTGPSKAVLTEKNPT